MKYYATTYTSLFDSYFEIKKSEDLIPLTPNPNFENWKLVSTSINETYIFWTWQLEKNDVYNNF